DLFPTPVTPKAAEIVVNQVAKDDGRTKNKAFFESGMREALTEARRVLDGAHRNSPEVLIEIPHP
ncbi:MAG: hypothetical protein HYU54_04115, partial [Actinobacteria bacterium]|nr:hypothetical protein [Actinomycetota bacterium]